MRSRAHAGEARRFRRIVEVLKLLPEHPASTTAWVVSVRLGEELRTIQRDLVLMHRVFKGKLIRSTTAAPHGWSWAPGKRASFLDWSK
jgi:hypothetical protein